MDPKGTWQRFEELLKSFRDQEAKSKFHFIVYRLLKNAETGSEDLEKILMEAKIIDKNLVSTMLGETWRKDYDWENSKYLKEKKSLSQNTGFNVGNSLIDEFSEEDEKAVFWKSFQDSSTSEEEDISAKNQISHLAQQRVCKKYSKAVCSSPLKTFVRNTKFHKNTDRQKLVKEHWSINMNLNIKSPPRPPLVPDDRLKKINKLSYQKKNKEAQFCQSKSIVRKRNTNFKLINSQNRHKSVQDFHSFLPGERNRNSFKNQRSFAMNTRSCKIGLEPNIRQHKNNIVRDCYSPPKSQPTRKQREMDLKIFKIQSPFDPQKLEKKLWVSQNLFVTSAQEVQRKLEMSSAISNPSTIDRYGIDSHKTEVQNTFPCTVKEERRSSSDSADELKFNIAKTELLFPESTAKLYFNDKINSDQQSQDFHLQSTNNFIFDDFKCKYSWCRLHFNSYHDRAQHMLNCRRPAPKCKKSKN